MMENDMRRSCSALACVVGLLASPAAWAQDPAAPPADPGAAAAPAPTPAAEPAAPAPQASQIPSWFRFDADSLGLQLWAGATHQVGPISLRATSTSPRWEPRSSTSAPPSRWVLSSSTRWWASRSTSRRCSRRRWSPWQLFTFVDSKPVYFESWILGSFSSMFDKSVQNYVYTRTSCSTTPSTTSASARTSRPRSTSTRSRSRTTH